MSEAALWRHVRTRLRKYGHLERVENAVSSGTPDLNYCLRWRDRVAEGWIELKQIDKWPRNQRTAVRVDHFTQIQRIWLNHRCLLGGRAFVLLQVGQTRMLFDGKWAAQHLGHIKRADLLDAAAWCDADHTWDQLAEILTR